jgi:hypothetical protein
MMKQGGGLSRGYQLLMLKWLITIALSLCLYTTTKNVYIPIAFIYTMIWQEASNLVIGNILLDGD